MFWAWCICEFQFEGSRSCSFVACGFVWTMNPGPKLWDYSGRKRRCTEKSWASGTGFKDWLYGPLFVRRVPKPKSWDSAAPIGSPKGFSEASMWFYDSVRSRQRVLFRIATINGGSFMSIPWLITWEGVGGYKVYCILHCIQKGRWGDSVTYCPDPHFYS